MQKELDQRYIPPAPADKMRVPGRAYYGANVKVSSAITAVQETDAPAATAATSADVGKKSKARRKRRAKGE